LGLVVRDHLRAGPAQQLDQDVVLLLGTAQMRPASIVPASRIV
jgi:hypothetical protein